MSENRLMTEANLISRLDRMPMNKSILGIVILLAWCWVMEAFDIGMISQVVLVLRQIWNLDANTLGLLGSCSTAGVVIGTICLGYLSDKYGRKKVLLWGTFVFTFFTLIGSLVENLAWIITMRFLSGLGAGVVFPLPYLMISELAPAKKRAILVCICNAILACAYLLPTLAGSWAIETFSLDFAWRVPFIIGGLPIVTIFLLSKYLPESPRWLMKHGRHDEVKALVERFEKSAGIEHDDSYIDEVVFIRQDPIVSLHDTVIGLSIGGGSRESELKVRASILGIRDKVTFMGNVPNDEVKDYLNAADLFLFASRSETQGIVLAEAFAAGCPVIAVHAVGADDVVKEGVNGFLTEEDEKCWAGKAVQALQPEIRERMSRAARADAENYRASRLAIYAEMLYNQCVLRKGDKEYEYSEDRSRSSAAAVRKIS